MPFPLVRTPPGSDLGVRFQEFGWRAGTPTVGAIGGVEDEPGVHPQWLYFFGVASLDAAVEAARARGATLFVHPVRWGHTSNARAHARGRGP